MYACACYEKPPKFLNDKIFICICLIPLKGNHYFVLMIHVKRYQILLFLFSSFLNP